MSPYGHVEHDAVSDVGRKRRNNEDAWLSLPQHGVFCVADGMGGADEGEVASGAIVDALIEAFRGFDAAVLSLDSKTRIIRRAVNRASAWILARSRSRGSGGSGSTFVAVTLDAAQPNRAVAVHVGDSRLYRYRAGVLKAITRDHSVAALEGLDNEEDLAPMFRSMVTRAVGLSESVKLEVTELDVTAGDRLFLCSDGLTRMVPDEALRKVLAELGDAPAKLQAQRLVDAANEAGGKDNVTVSFLRVGPLPAPAAVVDAGGGGDEIETVAASSPRTALDTDRGTADSGEPLSPPGGLPPDAGDVLVGKTPSSGHDLEPVVSSVSAPLRRAAPAVAPRTWPTRLAVGLGVAVLVAGAAGVVRILVSRPDQPGPQPCRVRVEPGPLDPGERVAVAVREPGATAWTAIDTEADLSSGPIDVRWQRTDYEPQQATVSLPAGQATLAPPGEWRPAPALAKLFELEAAAKAGRWQAVGAFLSGSGSAGVLERQAHRDRWAALRTQWLQRQTPEPTPPAVAVTTAAAVASTAASNPPAPAVVVAPVAVTPPAAAVVSAAVTPAPPAVASAAPTAATARPPPVDLRPPEATPSPPPSTEEPAAPPRPTAEDLAALHAAVSAARTNGSWHVAEARLGVLGGPPKGVEDASDLADIAQWRRWRDEVVRLGGAAAAERAYNEVARRIEAPLGFPEGSGVLAPAPASPAGDDEELASLCRRVQAWRAAVAERGLDALVRQSQSAALAASEPPARAAWSNYWRFARQEAAAGEFATALGNGSRGVPLGEAAAAARDALARYAAVPPTPAELDRLLSNPDLAQAVTDGLQPWLMVPRHAAGLVQGLQLLSADSLTALHREKLPAECAEVDRCLSRVQALAARLRSVPTEGPAATVWLLRGGWMDVMNAAQDVDRLTQSVDALKAAVTARRQRR